jgi:hypothetical protein
MVGLGRGRPRKYCRQSHRQRAYESRLVVQGHNAGTDSVVVSIEDLHRLADRLYTLESAVEDVEEHLADDPGAYEEAFEHLHRAASGLRGARIGASAVRRGEIAT